MVGGTRARDDRSAVLGPLLAAWYRRLHSLPHSAAQSHALQAKIQRLAVGLCRGGRRSTRSSRFAFERRRRRRRHIARVVSLHGLGRLVMTAHVTDWRSTTWSCTGPSGTPRASRVAAGGSRAAMPVRPHVGRIQAGAALLLAVRVPDVIVFGKGPFTAAPDSATVPVSVAVAMFARPAAVVTRVPVVSGIVRAGSHRRETDRHGGRENSKSKKGHRNALPYAVMGQMLHATRQPNALRGNIIHHDLRVGHRSGNTGACVSNMPHGSRRATSLVAFCQHSAGIGCRRCKVWRLFQAVQRARTYRP